MTTIVTAIQQVFRALKEHRCWSISFHTQEIDDEQILRLHKTNGQLVKLVISDDNIDNDVIKLVENVSLQEKEKWTPSQKLRFAIHEQARNNNLVDKDEIEAYYRAKMIEITDRINKETRNEYVKTQNWINRQ